ncbi:MAG: hypothetical protein RI973_1578, partial [Bacteroidota bacterium]
PARPTPGLCKQPLRLVLLVLHGFREGVFRARGEAPRPFERGAPAPGDF